MNIEEYEKIIKTERSKAFAKPYDFVYQQFELLAYDKQDENYFMENASDIIEKLRQQTWHTFLPLEEAFTSKMLLKLFNENDIKNMTSFEAVVWFAETFPNHIYKLNLSNTQSRRSRAGKEFEAIIELLLIGANIRLDSQGNIGKKFFIDKGLGKLVDVVSPSAIEYVLNKRNTVLVSAKTTLRERWQEVPEEMGRTGAREMFLATLDSTITKEVIDNLSNANIQVVTTKNIKFKHYASYNNVIDFEELLVIMKDNLKRWQNYQYDAENQSVILAFLDKQKRKHLTHPFVAKFYQNQIDVF
jgi:hypothetical protein